MKSKCRICGQPTLKYYYTLCLDCWKEEQDQETEDTNSITIQVLMSQIKSLKDQLNHAQNRSTALPIDLKRKLRQLCHPDKHNGSELATSVFKELENL